VEYCLGAKALTIRKLNRPLGRELPISLGAKRLVIKSTVDAEWNEADKGKKDDEGGSANLVVICIIPCPCPPGKDPRAPLVPYQLDGKPIVPQVYLQPVKSLLEADLLLLIRTPLVHSLEPCLLGKELLRAVGPFVACFLATACYLRSLLGGFSAD
jgi:hypothetical protein